MKSLDGPDGIDEAGWDRAMMDVGGGEKRAAQRQDVIDFDARQRASVLLGEIADELPAAREAPVSAIIGALLGVAISAATAALRADLARVKAQRDRLREAICAVMHRVDCACRHNAELACTCGLRAAMEEP